IAMELIEENTLSKMRHSKALLEQQLEIPIGLFSPSEWLTSLIRGSANLH
ncbi:uncharacterized protein METZ01_LOCUS487677, partial [marine metagenome]